MDTVVYPNSGQGSLIASGKMIMFDLLKANKEILSLNWILL